MAQTLASASGHAADVTQPRGHRLKSLRIVGGFLDGTAFDFADDLNCIIGARGTGKTTILEFVRFVLDALPGADADAAARRRIESLIEHNLAGGRVQVAIETKDGLPYVVSRAAGEEAIVLTDDGTPTEIALRADGVFNADIYSQNDVESIADRALSQLVLIDNFQPERVAEFEARLRAVVGRLATSAGAIGPLQEQITGLAEEIDALPGVEEKLKGFVAVGGSDADAINAAHAQKSLRDRERRAVDGMAQFLTEHDDQLRSLENQIAQRTTAFFASDVINGPNGAALSASRQAMLDCGAAVDAGLRRAREVVQAAHAGLGQCAASLSGQHAQQEMAFRALIEKHEATQNHARERSRLETLKNDLLAKQRQRDELNARLAKLLTERQALLQELSDLRNQRFAIRQSVVDRINAALSPTIRASVVESGNPEAYRRL